MVNGSSAPLGTPLVLRDPKALDEHLAFAYLTEV